MDGWKCSTRGRVLAAKVAIAASLFPVSLSLGQTPSNPDGTTPASPAATAPAAPLAANSAPTAGAATRLAPPRQIQTDSDLKQTGFGHHDYPSSQQQYDATCPPVPTKPPPTTPAPVAPTYTPPAYAPQYAPVYAPQYAPTYAPQYAPVYAPQYAPMPPMMPQYAAPPAPPAAPSNYFLPSAPPAAPPAPPAYSAPMMPMAPVYSMPMAPAFAAPQPPAMVPGAALSNSSVSVPTSRASTRTRVRGPGPLASGPEGYAPRGTAHAAWPSPDRNHPGNGARYTTKPADRGRCNHLDNRCGPREPSPDARSSPSRACGAAGSADSLATRTRAAPKAFAVSSLTG